MIKKFLKNILVFFCIISLLSFNCIVLSKEKEKSVQILFTHDLHSSIEQTKAKNGNYGGFARLFTLIKKKREENLATVLVDGGDFSMGSLYQTLYETDAAELMLLGYMGYDAVTLGNHEFDYQCKGVENMLSAAVASAQDKADLKLPYLVLSNIDRKSKSLKENLSLSKALKDYGCREYVIVEKNGIKIGIFGLLGKNALDCVPEMEIEFENAVLSAKRTVKSLKKQGADLIICLSHSGTDENEDNSEDMLLAKKVPDIDVIVSGHTHTKLSKPLRCFNTYIVSAEAYGKYLGELDLVQGADKRWQLKGYRLNATKASVKEDKALLSITEGYKGLIDKKYLSNFGYTSNQVLAVNNIDFTPISRLGKTYGEETLGNIISDSYIYAVRQAEGEDYTTVSLAVTDAGTIRSTLKKGTLTVWDIFNTSSLGIGPDRLAGYPLVSVYLTGREIKTVAEIDVSASSVMPAVQIFQSGVKWSYNPNRIILNKVTDVKLVAENGKQSELVDNKLYRVVGGLYVAQMLGLINEASLGILRITPKDKYGNKITDFNECIIRDKQGNEIKEWYALACFLESFEKNEDGIAEIPKRYSKAQGRKEENSSKNIVDILKKPNTVAIIVYSLSVFVIMAVIFFIRLIIIGNRKRIHKS